MIMENLLENQLILRCKQGDSSAFGLLVKNYRKQLYTYLVRMSGSRVAAEDLLQDTLIKAWKAIPKYKEQNKFSSWLFSIAHNIAMDSYRKNKVRAIIKYTDEQDNEPGSESLQYNIETEELKNIIIESIETLSEKQQHVFLLRQHSGMSFKEIAEATDQPLNTVLSHMNYAVKKLKKILREKNAI
ncbi:MAG: hypothetical protein CVV23_01390 [Ignavibacteriae bacterium HGW-Ignavibacteriae-2]|nr:MAG: hypothetical protein CVV23_01390 [Ignavibacteriae bacterium HGW-Ignavibacteriae-2]